MTDKTGKIKEATLKTVTGQKDIDDRLRDIRVTALSGIGKLTPAAVQAWAKRNSDTRKFYSLLLEFNLKKKPTDKNKKRNHPRTKAGTSGKKDFKFCPY